MLSFRVNVPNRPSFGQDMLVVLFVDADNNPATGDPDPLGQGVDYVVEIFGGEAALFRWDGTNFTRRAGDPPATSLIFSYQGGITINISTAELGNTKALKFNVHRVLGDHHRSDDERPRLHERSRRHRAGRRGGPLPVRGQDHAADAGRAQPQADSQEPR